MDSMPGTDGPDRSIENEWTDHRKRLLDLGYRMLGSVSEAEDVVQEAYARLLVADRAGIDDVVGWLMTITSRLCIDRLRSHDRSKRSYLGPWLPEPLVVDDRWDVADRITLDDSVRMALLVVLEQLSPAERTAFVLHDVFGLSFDRIGEIVGRSAQACRQLASRARRHIEEDRAVARFEVDEGDHRAVVEQFADACHHGDFDALVRILDPAVIGDFDSGGVIRGAPLTELDGAVPVARQLVATVSRSGATFIVASVNGEPGVVLELDGAVLAVIAVGVHAGRVDVLHGIGNPDKLTHLR